MGVQLLGFVHVGLLGFPRQKIVLPVAPGANPISGNLCPDHLLKRRVVMAILRGDTKILCRVCGKVLASWSGTGDVHLQENPCRDCHTEKQPIPAP